MTTFTISNDNNITAFATPEAAQDTLAQGALAFASQKEFAKLAADWPAARLVEVWNAFAGVVPFGDLKPVKKFTDRKGAVARIWKAIQKLDGGAPESAPENATTDATSNTPKAAKGARRVAKGAPKKAHATKATRTKDGPPTAREGSKKALVLELLRRKGGATLAEIAKATDWQNHSIRGFISGTIAKRMGLKVESTKNASGERTYRVTK